ncbi:hypothetical protein ACFWVU_36040 [Streptomyces sp. NPDC058686]|uniref:hypothetical protein n=1 Tax=Streptomyces sp. NPDC058686 TaxID=3346599 RepID=UPI003646F5F0
MRDAIVGQIQGVALMMDLELQIKRVWHQEVRPLVAEAYRCYTTGSSRACIVLTWTSVCTDLIHKLYQLAEDGEGEAEALVKRIDGARGKSDRDAVRTMLEVENTILDVAAKLELIDFVEKRELERLKEDRNLAAHPSLRPLGELFTPTTEYARAHLTAAVESLLVHPPSQGRKARDRFRDHVGEVSFVGSSAYLAQVFFDRVKSGTRRNIVAFAAKEALLELTGVGALSEMVMADRYATCLRAFAERDRAVVQDAIASVIGRLGQQPLHVQIRALVRLGDLDAFWDQVDEAMRTQLGDYVEQIDLPDGYDPLTADQIGVLGLVELKHVRMALPALEPKFQGLSAWQKASVIRHRPGPYVAGYVADILEAAQSWRTAESTAKQTVSTCAPYVTSEQLSDILSSWAENYECRTASGMLELAVKFFFLVPSSLRKDSAWQTFLDSVREQEEPDSPFRYDELEQAILAASSSSK